MKAELPRASETCQGWRGESDKADHADRADNEGGQRHGDHQRQDTKCPHRNTETTSTFVIEREHRKRPGEKRSDQAGHEQPRQKIEDFAPIILNEAARIPDENALQIIPVEQYENRAASPREQVDDQPTEDQGQRGKTCR